MIQQIQNWCHIITSTLQQEFSTGARLCSYGNCCLQRQPMCYDAQTQQEG